VVAETVHQQEWAAFSEWGKKHKKERGGASYLKHAKRY